jgi:peptide chain release factor subunit 3
VALGAPVEPAKQVAAPEPAENKPVETKKVEEDWEKTTPVPAKKAETAPAPAAKAAPASKVVEEPDEDEGQVKEEDPRDHLNVVNIGHVDAGKSTLCGAILLATGVVDKRTIEKYEKEAKERNRESWFLAYIMDTNEEERAKGKTVEVGTANFETAKKRFTLLDAPGHKNYVPAMIAGASHADVGVLVISSRKGEFESGFEKQGQTREHAMLAFTIGIRKLIVAVNKLDDPSVDWAKERYDEIERKLTPFLKSCGYKVKKDVIFMPIAALPGAGVLRRITEQECKWATEINENKSLIEILEGLQMEGRDPAGNLRISVLDSYVDRGVWALGKIESGTLERGMTVAVSPTAGQAKVGSILIDEVSVRSAKPGENICVKLSGLTDESDCRKGYVLTDTRIGCKTFTATIKILELLEHRSIFTAGYTAVLHAHTIISDCVVTKILWKHDAEGKPIKERCTFAKDGEIVTVRLEVPQSIAIESFDVRPQLGRITLRDEGRSVAIGKVKKLEA